MRRGASAAVVVIALRGAACAQDRPVCHAGEYAACACADGAVGYAVCQERVASYGSCVCDGKTPGLDASTSTDPDASADARPIEAKRALLEDCATNDQCASGLCFAYGQGYSLCSKPCSVDADCPAPSSGCNGKKVCKGP